MVGARAVVASEVDASDCPVSSCPAPGTEARHTRGVASSGRGLRQAAWDLASVRPRGRGREGLERLWQASKAIGENSLPWALPSQLRTYLGSLLLT